MLHWCIRMHYSFSSIESRWSLRDIFSKFSFPMVNDETPIFCGKFIIIIMEKIKIMVHHSSSAACAPLARRRTSTLTGNSLSFSSAHLNLSLSLQTAACRRMVFPCCTIELPPSFQPFMSWQGPTQWFRASSARAQTTRFRTPCGTRFQTVQLLIPAWARQRDREPAFWGNVWMWNYGRAFPRKISVGGCRAAMRRKRVQPEDLRRHRVAETLKRRHEASAVRPAE